MATHSKSWFMGVIDLVLLSLLIPLMFFINWFTGIMYVVTLLGLLFSGAMFKRKGLVLLVILGTILSFFAWFILPSAVDSYSAGDYLSFAILLVFTVLIWYLGFRMKKGNI
jgi:hypothetical protein